MTIPHEEAEKATPEKANSQGAQPKPKSRLARLSLAALGVVFGDISTSPLYAIRACFHGEYGIDVSHANVLGILSLMFWAPFSWWSPALKRYMQIWGISVPSPFV